MTIPAVRCYKADVNFYRFLSELENTQTFLPEGTDLWTAGRVGGTQSVVHSHRTSMLIPLDWAVGVNPGLVSIFDEIHQAVETAVHSYRNEFGLSLDFAEGYTVNKYGAGAEYKQHVDAGSDISRILSMVCFLNTPEDGGGLHFPLFEKTIAADSGTIVLFPSTHPYLHAALPVMAVKTPKYSLVNWYGKSQ